MCSSEKQLVRVPWDRGYIRFFPYRLGTAKKPYNQEAAIATYKRLIHSMAHANQYLLLYVLDLLSVFSRKSDKNLMTAQSKLFLSPPPASPCDSSSHK